jgi:hypothetical protein
MYIIENVMTKQKTIFNGKDTDGIGSIAVHPEK